MAARGIPVPQGEMVTTVAEAMAAVAPLVESAGNPVVVVKSQIHAGGRGKGRFVEYPELAGVNVVLDGIEGGIEVTKRKVGELAGRMLGSTLVTVQTGPEGKKVNRLYIEQGVDIERELYISIVLDRSSSKNIVMVSTEGGTEIEVVAEETPDKILKAEIDPGLGLLDFQARELAFGLGLAGPALRNGVRFIKALSEAAVELDTDLIEINPLVVTKDGAVLALDGKMSFEANALYRQPEVQDMRDLSEENAAEIEASGYGISFIKLDGTIGCMVNGAGLAMATMDIIKYVGGEPANFLDVGGGAEKDQVAAAFKIITRDPSVKGIFVNIFGGIMKCDTIAQGIIDAVAEVGLDMPLVVRLEGTNVELGKQILDESGLNIVSASDMKDGAQRILEATQA